MTDISNFVDQAKLLALLANDKRLLIASLIFQEEHNVTDLAEKVGLSQSALSQHLARFRAAGVVATRRDAQTIYYSTSHEGVRRILEALDQMSIPSTIQRQARAK